MIHALFACLPLLASGSPLQEPTPFPTAEPESVGLSSEALDALATFVEEQVSADEYVGAELLIIKDGKTVLHDAWGWQDREREVPLEPDALFNVRSMTKPLTGTAAQMLIEDGRLALDDAVASWLPAFDHDAARAITIQHLLEHRAGLPMSSLIGKPLSEHEDLRALADRIGANGPDEPPGTAFHYSDDGTSVLAACVEAAADVPFARFLHERILTPLGMSASTFDVADEGLRDRICTSYMGAPGSWVRQWSPDDDPLYPFLLGSQGLYCTARDYARFLSAWMNRGRFDDVRLLPARAVRRALKPASEAVGIPSGMQGLEVHYGQMWVLYVDPSLPRTKQVSGFGHSGSDGTYALAWPDLDLMALCFTQSRGSRALLDFERELHRRVLAPGELPPYEASAAELEELAGYYWSRESDLYGYLDVENGRLMAELPGRARLRMRHLEPDRLTFDLAPTVRFTVVRDDAGRAIGFDVAERDDSDEWRRFEPGEGMPPLARILEKARMRERAERLTELGGLRWTGRISREQPEMEGHFVFHGLPDGRHRREIDAGPQTVVTVWDGERAFLRIEGRRTDELTGKLAAQARLDHPAFSEMDWTELFDRLIPVRTGQHRGRTTWLVRALRRDAHPVTLGLDTETGRLIGTMQIAVVPGSGEMGITAEYDDWREIEGLEFPFVQRTRAASALIGELVLSVESLDTGLELGDELFQAPEDE